MFKVPLNQTLFSFPRKPVNQVASSLPPSWSKCSGLAVDPLTFRRTTFLGPNTFLGVRNTRLAKTVTQYETQFKWFNLLLILRTLSSFYCQCSTPPFFTVTTEVTFVDTTVYPDAPRGAPQPQWKFPFGFFTGGTAELDGHTVLSSGGSSAAKVTWSLMLFTVMLLTGLEFFTR